jgi:hypothetical protein
VITLDDRSEPAWRALATHRRTAPSRTQLDASYRAMACRSWAPHRDEASFYGPLPPPPAVQRVADRAVLLRKQSPQEGLGWCAHATRSAEPFPHAPVRAQARALAQSFAYSLQVGKGYAKSCKTVLRRRAAGGSGRSRIQRRRT